MIDKNQDSRRFSHSNHNCKPFFRNYMLNHLNFDNLLEKQLKINKENDIINKYNNKNRINKRSITHEQLSIDKNKKRNSSNIILKRYLYGNDVILPLKSIKELENTNIPYYKFNYNKEGNKFNTINNISNIQKNKYNYLTRQKTYDEYKSNKRLRKKTNNFRRILLKNNIESKKILNTNYDLNKNDFIDSTNNSNINFDFKTKLNTNKKMDSLKLIKESSSKYKTFKRINSSFPSKRLKIKKSNSTKKNKYIKKDSNKYNYLIENYRKKLDNNKNDLFINKAKRLIDEPDSVVYLLYKKMKDVKFDEEKSKNKLNLKNQFIEYKKDLNNLEERVRLELFNLKRQAVIGRENNIKGRIISTNTFFNLAFGGY